MNIMLFKVFSQLSWRLRLLIKRFDLAVVQVKAISSPELHLLELGLLSALVLGLGCQLDLILPHKSLLNHHELLFFLFQVLELLMGISHLLGVLKQEFEQVWLLGPAVVIHSGASFFT